jgi:hypothetical protein
MFGRDPLVKPTWCNASKTLLGVNCLQPFGYGYPFTNGGNDAAAMPDERLNKLVSLGFDYVRMAVDPEPLLSADSASNVTTTVLDSRIAEAIAGVARRTAVGLRVIVDFHFHGSATSYAAGWTYTDVLDGGTKATRAGFVLVRLATAIAANCSASLVCFEVFNEPPAPGLYSTANWITQIETWWTAVRAVMPAHTIVVAGNNLNAIDSLPAGVTSGLTALTASHFDTNTGFAIHEYESAVFTHQGVVGSVFEYGHNIYFPASRNTSQAAVEAAFTAAAGGDSNAINTVVTQTGWASSIAEYYATYGTQAKLAVRLKVATDWAVAAGISKKAIFSTEGGVNFLGTDDAPDDSATAFIRAAKENAQAAGIACFTVHEMQGSNFAVQNTSSPFALKPPIQAALFG